MSARHAAGRGEAVVRSVGLVAERAASPAVEPARGFVAMDALREHVDGLKWAPLRLSGERRGRPASPRLPHALVLHLAHAARLASVRASTHVPGPLAPGVVPDLDALGSFVGTDPDGVAGALGALEAAGVVQGGGASTAAVRLAPALLADPPRCAALDWSRVALATAGSPSAWVAAHVLAERLVPDEWTPMPRSALERTLGCGVSGVRSALDRLTIAAVVERREQRGGVSAYRFATSFWSTAGLASAELDGGAAASAGAAVPLRDAAPGPGQPTSVAPRASSVPTAPSGATMGVRLTIGGVELDVPAGLRVQIALGTDGTPQISLVPVASAPG